MKPVQKNIILLPLNFLYKYFPKVILKFLFYIKNGYILNLNNPRTYNEKLQYVKLYYKNKLLTQLVDKYLVRNFVEKRGCKKILNLLLWSGFDPDNIPFKTLPNKFVLKVTHGSGFNIICKDKRLLDFKKANNTLSKWLNEKFIVCYGEWFYGVEKPRIIVEEYLDNSNGKELIDYKIFCFSGEPKYIIVDTDRFTHHKRNVYDLNWRFKEGYTLNFENDIPMEKPEQLELLLKYAKKLSAGFPHVRVDLYIVDNKIYFGEMTFTNGAGFDKILPKSFDEELGSYFDISKFNIRREL